MYSASKSTSEAVCIGGPKLDPHDEILEEYYKWSGTDQLKIKNYYMDPNQYSKFSGKTNASDQSNVTNLHTRKQSKRTNYHTKPENSITSNIIIFS